MEKTIIDLYQNINEGKLVVGVEQKHTGEKYQFSNVWESEQTNILQLLAFLYRKTIQKCYNLTIKYNYNYTDKQTITIVEKYQNYDNTYTYTKYTFYNVPTSLGYIDIYKLKEKLNNEKEQ